MLHVVRRTGAVFIGLGSNLHPKEETADFYLLRALEFLKRRRDICVHKVSRFYISEALRTSGGASQSQYVNAVIAVSTFQTAGGLLRLLKTIEQKCDRRGQGSRWSARTLDLDIIDFKGVIRGWRKCAPFNAHRGSLVLPHGHAHLRPFVLEPLREISEKWRHPVLRLTADELLWRSSRRTRRYGGEIIAG